MSLRDIINAAKSIASATGKIGKLYPHRVWSSDDAAMKNLFVVNGKLDVCFITRESSDAQDRGPNNAYRLPLLVLDWYRAKHRAADDSTNSEDAFQDDVETVMDAFDSNRKLRTGMPLTAAATWSGPMKARTVNVVTFCGVMCDHAELVTVVEDGPRSTTSA
jgi:hypothetical protein